MKIAMAMTATARTAPPADAPTISGKRFVFFDCDGTARSRHVKNVELLLGVTTKTGGASATLSEFRSVFSE